MKYELVIFGEYETIRKQFESYSKAEEFAMDYLFEIDWTAQYEIKEKRNA